MTKTERNSLSNIVLVRDQYRFNWSWSRVIVNSLLCTIRVCNYIACCPLKVQSKGQSQSSTTLIGFRKMQTAL